MHGESKMRSQGHMFQAKNLPNKHELQKWQNPVLCFPCQCIKEHYILIWWTNKCTCINMSNHILLLLLLLFTNMFQSLLWPSSGCYITISAKRQMYEHFMKLLFQFFQNNNMTVNKQNKKGICFLNWFMTYHTTHAPNSTSSIFLTTYLTPFHTQFSCDSFHWVQFHLSNRYVITVTTVFLNIQLFHIPW